MELLYLLVFAAGWSVCWLQFRSGTSEYLPQQTLESLLDLWKSDYRQLQSEYLELQSKYQKEQSANQMLQSAFQELERLHLQCRRQRSGYPVMIPLSESQKQRFESPVVGKALEQVKPRYNNEEPSQ